MGFRVEGCGLKLRVKDGGFNPRPLNPKPYRAEYLERVALGAPPGPILCDCVVGFSSGV